MSKKAKIRNLKVGFETEAGSILAVDNINFSLYPEKTLALLGESGCGKSLSSLAIMRLLPNSSFYGIKSEINIDGTDVLELPESLMQQIRGRKVAMIFQEPMTALNPVLTIGQQIKEAITLSQNHPKQDLHEKAINLLKEVEIAEPNIKINNYPHQLSGGQKQRVVIAMALAFEPEILIADEPTTALDVTIQAQILSLLKKLQQKHKMSMLFITHDLGVVKEVADFVVVMYAGEIVEKATRDDFFKNPMHPYSQKLLVAMPNIEKRGYKLHNIEGNVPAIDAKPKGCHFHPRCNYKFDKCTSESPHLINMDDTREVRCFLYPEIGELPELKLVQESHKELKGSVENLLVVDNLQVQFPIKTTIIKKTKYLQAVKNVSFSLERGRTLALVGESGSGKTTTAQAIMRLLPDISGKILFQGRDVTNIKGRDLEKYRRDIQIIFQDPFSSMNPRMLVRDIIAEGMYAAKFKTKNIDNLLYNLLDDVNLPKNSLSKYPHQFSGGQRQRIAIARALALKPKLLVCDEPTSALDISVQAQVLNLLKDLQIEHNLSYLFITHDLSVVAYIADIVAVMQNGQIVEQQETEAIFKNPQMAYTKKLLASVLSNSC